MQQLTDIGRAYVLLIELSREKKAAALLDSQVPSATAAESSKLSKPFTTGSSASDFTTRRPDRQGGRKWNGTNQKLAE